MRWPVFLIVAYLVMVLQVGLAPHIGFDTRFGRVEPQVVLLLAVFVALSAPTATTVVACSILGFLLDLASVYSVVRYNDAGAVIQQSPLVLVGPYTLGYMIGGYMVVQFRPMLFRQHPMTVAAMMFICGAAVHITVAAIFTARRFYEPLEGFTAQAELAKRGMSLLYSAGIGLVLALPLGVLAPYFGFQPVKAGGRQRA